MKCLVIADLHLDYFFGQRMDPFIKVPKGELDDITHCIIAGDLSNKSHKQWPRCLTWLAERLPDTQIYVMPGNHDYYDFQIDQEDRLEAIAARHGAAFIQKTELISGNQRFLCATLWTDFEVYGDRIANMENGARVMNDYQRIKVAKSGHRRLSPAMTAEIHQDHRAWLEARLADGFDGDTTVITHHAPHRKALSAEPSYGPCYASNLEAMILKYQPKRWLFGHTHHPVTFTIGATELRNVSVGYPSQHEPIEQLDRFIVEVEEL